MKMPCSVEHTFRVDSGGHARSVAARMTRKRRTGQIQAGVERKADQALSILY